MEGKEGINGDYDPDLYVDKAACKPRPKKACAR